LNQLFSIIRSFLKINIFLATFNSKFKQSKLFECISMKIKDIINNIWCYLITHRKIGLKNDLDAKFWIQDILLKNHLKSVNKNN